MSLLPARFNPRPRARDDRRSSVPRAARAGFNPRPRARDDTARRRSRRRLTCFNPRPRARDDRVDEGKLAAFTGFQSTPPREGRHHHPLGAPTRGAVSIHAPARGTTWSTAWVSSMAVFQSTPPREGRLHGVDPAARGADVSIHAPARGTTRATCACSSVRDVFQSTPPREGRPATASRPAASGRRFNPRPRARDDPRRRRDRRPVADVSIHAPARGTTVRPRGVAGGGDVSIHAPARGTTGRGRPPHLLQEFQSTPPREGRHSSPCLGAMTARFNPRPRARDDLRHRHLPRAVAVSIHAPARGTTCRLALGGEALRMFQSTPPREGRRATVDRRMTDRAFQSTPPREGRPTPAPAQGAPRSFNPRPRARDDVRRS